MENVNKKLQIIINLNKFRFSTTYQSKHGYVIQGLGKEGPCGGSSLTSWQFQKEPSTILSTGKLVRFKDNTHTY